MADFSFSDGSQVQVSSEEGTVVIFQQSNGVPGRAPARMSAAEALQVADAIVAAAEAASTPAQAETAASQPDAAAQEAPQ